MAHRAEDSKQRNNRMQTKTNYQTLHILGDEMRAKVRPDDSGDKSIAGKLGDIIEGTLDGVQGYYVSLMYVSARKLGEVLKSFRCARLTQRGDSEAVIFISHDNAMSRAEDLRVAINARKRPTLTGEQRQQKALRVLQVRANPDHLVGLTAKELFVMAGHARAFYHRRCKAERPNASRRAISFQAAGTDHLRSALSPSAASKPL